jgi:hypothetical protein
MSAMEFSQPSQGGAVAGITSQMAAERARTVVLHNGRIVCWGMKGVAVCSLFIGVCMVLMIFSLLSPIERHHVYASAGRGAVGPGRHHDGHHVSVAVEVGLGNAS